MNPSPQSGFSVGEFIVLIAFAAAFSVVTILSADRAAIQRARTMVLEVRPLRQEIEHSLRIGNDPRQALRAFHPSDNGFALVNAVSPDGTIGVQDKPNVRPASRAISMSLKPQYDPASGRIDWACDGTPQDLVQQACDRASATDPPH